MTIFFVLYTDFKNVSIQSTLYHEWNLVGKNVIGDSKQIDTVNF